MKKAIKYIKFFIALILFFFGSFLQLIPIFIFKIDLETASNFINLLLTIFSNSIVFIILVLMYRKSIIEGFKDLKKKKFKPLIEGFNYWFIGLIVMVISNMLISLLKDGGTSTNEESVALMLKSFPALAAISISILSPWIEELVFRKSFRDIFKNKWLYLCTSGLIFGALHVLLSPIYSFVDYLYLIPYCSMGVAFSYMYYKTDNIMVPITLHMLHNTLNVLSTLLLTGMILW